MPPLPSSVFELNEYKNIDNTNTTELISIIGKDPLMIITILKIVNSSMFGFKGKIETLERAINLLGINFTISVAIGSAIQNNINGNLLAYAVKNDDFIFSSALASNIVNTWVSNINFDLKKSIAFTSIFTRSRKIYNFPSNSKNRRTEEFWLN